ncbi:TPA: hypothetical protein EYP45_01965 [Candidatus Peregrinibacteria bacterium]|nr:hypothetical protein [Candidatus Peregrinibacteria bacterium]HIQ57457.1 hypothetical protein [Candidatus Gracilibacteria bacterium]
MAEDTTKKDEVALVIPDETKEKYPDLVQKIINSKSMNNSERNYWLQVLPVMTEEQVKELQDILDTEIRKLKEIDEKYSKMEAAAAAKGGKKPAVELSKEDIAKMDAEKIAKRKVRADAERKAQEENSAEDILSQLDF